MTRCRLCLIPDTRPDTAFLHGICSACVSFAGRPQIDWATRRRAIEGLLERGRNTTGFDCIVPSSGGKDSHWQALKLLELGARPLIVTASTCMLTPIGRENIDNLARHATTIEVTPNTRVRALLNRLGFERVGDISWPEHVSIFTTPFRIAAALGIPLIFYGENPQNQYGGPQGSEQALEMTRRWRSEFGGFLGMRPSDLVGELGITERDMADYEMPSEEAMRAVGVEAHFLGQYFEWDSARNLDAAVTAGMKVACPTPANWWAGENLDCAFTGLHDHGMYRKFGYGRGAAQISVDIRHGRITRESALQWARTHDGLFPWFYCGVSLSEMLAALSVDDAWLDRALERFTNRELFEGIEDRRPMLLPGGWE